MQKVAIRLEEQILLPMAEKQSLIQKKVTAWLAIQLTAFHK